MVIGSQHARAIARAALQRQVAIAINVIGRGARVELKIGVVARFIEVVDAAEQPRKIDQALVAAAGISGERGLSVAAFEHVAQGIIVDSAGARPGGVVAAI